MLVLVALGSRKPRHQQQTRHHQQKHQPENQDINSRFACLLFLWCLVLVALGSRAHAQNKSLENTFFPRRTRGPSISNLRQTKIVPKDQRLHFTEVPNSFGSQVEHNLQDTVKIHFFSICRPKTLHIAVFYCNPPPTRRRTRGESIRHRARIA